MNRRELLKRLKGNEWTDVEFKEARQDVPKSAYDVPRHAVVWERVCSGATVDCGE